MFPIAFGVIAACILGAALLAVTSRSLVHSVLWLAVTLLTTAAMYVLLDATLLGAIQVLLYTGGVITLMLFGVMLTEQGQAIETPNPSPRRLSGVALAAIVFGLIAAVVSNTEPMALPDSAAITARQIGRSFLTDHLLAFETLSVLLLAAMLGAIVVARRRDP